MLPETPIGTIQGDNYVSGKNALYTAGIAVLVVIAMQKLGKSGGIRIGS